MPTNRTRAAAASPAAARAERRRPAHQATSKRLDRELERQGPRRERDLQSADPRQGRGRDPSIASAVLSTGRPPRRRAQPAARASGRRRRAGRRSRPGWPAGRAARSGMPCCATRIASAAMPGDRQTDDDPRPDTSRWIAAAAVGVYREPAPASRRRTGTPATRRRRTPAAPSPRAGAPDRSSRRSRAGSAIRSRTGRGRQGRSAGPASTGRGGLWPVRLLAMRGSPRPPAAPRPRRGRRRSRGPGVDRLVGAARFLRLRPAARR